MTEYTGETIHSEFTTDVPDTEEKEISISEEEEKRMERKKRRGNKAIRWIGVGLAVVAAAGVGVYLAYSNWRGASRRKAPNLQGLPDNIPVDLNSYKGLWYEMRRLDNTFERGQFKVTAEYALDPEREGQISVYNRSQEGKASDINGYAVQTQYPNVLMVSFFPFISAPYVVCALDNGYKWAIVGSPDRKFLWFLTRDPSIFTPQLRSSLESRAEMLGFDTAAMIDGGW